MNSPAEHTQL